MIRRLLAVVLITGAVSLAVTVWWTLLRPGPAHEVEFEVRPGAATTTILRELKSADLLPSRIMGRLYLMLRGKGREFHYGWYSIGAGTPPIDVLERILDGRVETLEVTIVEGTMADEVEDRLSSVGLPSSGDWQLLLQQTRLVQDFAPGATSLEGYLFPDTYRFAVGLAQEQALEVMVERFREVWAEETSMIDTLWGTPEEIVTLASLVEAETSLPEERHKVAGVFANRLKRGMLLQCDPTVVYALHRRGEWTGRLLRVHWLIDHPYNTYRYPGLPPGPINSPGRASLAAALAPEEHAYLFFVARPGGGHTFSRTLREHNRAVAVLQRSRR